MLTVLQLMYDAKAHMQRRTLFVVSFDPSPIASLPYTHTNTFIQSVRLTRRQ